MDGTERSTIYEAFGFRVRSVFPMPELPMHDDQMHADIDIRTFGLTSRWREIADSGRLSYVQGDQVWFLVPDTAIFCVAAGHTILVSPIEGMDRDKVRLYLLGTCMAVILLQRKILPLHGSAIKIGDMAYAIVGDSGAGKSTLASTLMRQGCRLVSDDLIAVSAEGGSDGPNGPNGPNDEQAPEVIPSYPQQKLWSESIRRLQMRVDDFRPLFEREDKYAIPVQDRFYGKRLPFGGVFDLVKTDGEGDVELIPLNRLESVRALQRHTFRNFFVAKLGLQQWHLDVTVRLLKHIQVRQLRRPSNANTAHVLAESILSFANRRNQDAEHRYSSPSR